MPPLRLRAWVWVCMATVRLAACGGSWKEERKEREGSGGLQQPRRAAIFRNLFSLAGWIRLGLSVILVYGRPLDLY